MLKMMTLGFRAMLGVVLVALALAATTLTASAHEHRDVGAYTFVVGFLDEPAVQGDMNGVSLTVTSTKDQKPVEGLTDTLKVTVIFQKNQKEMTLTPVFNKPGAYEAAFIPTQPGDYTFHFTGTINGQKVDEAFTSSPNTFDSVAPRTDYEFPAQQSRSAGNRVAMPVAAAGVMLVLAGGAFALRKRQLDKVA